MLSYFGVSTARAEELRALAGPNTPAAENGPGESQPLSQGTPTAPVAADTPDAFPSLGVYFGSIPADIAGGSSSIFSRENLPFAIVGAGATIVAFTLDRSTQTYFEDHRPLGGGDKLGAKIGSRYTLAGGAVSLFLGGELLRNRQLADTGMVTAEALVVDALATEALKYATHRKRPNGGNNMSFPSGHASATATFAATVSEMYDWNPFVAVPLYAVTAFVSAGRIQGGEHHLSDVVAGVALGTVIGKSFAGYKKRQRTGQHEGMRLIGVLPLLEDGQRGIMMVLQF
jgi:membrane-associated phospholipid phosphatase